MTPPAASRIAVLALLSLATVVLFGLVASHRAIGPELLANRDFSAALAGWHRLGDVGADAGVAALANRTGAPVAALYQDLWVEAGTLLRIECEIKVAGVAGGKARWQRPRLLLVTFDRRDQPRWQVTHMAAAPTGNSDWTRYQVVARVPRGNPHILAGAQLAAASGRMWLRHFSLRPVEPDPRFQWLRNALLALWLPALVWTAWPVARSAFAVRGGAALIAVAAAIAVATLMPQPAKLALLGLAGELERAIAAGIGWPASGPVAAAGAAAFAGDLSWSGQYLDKIGHFLIHLILGATVALLYWRQRPWPILGYLVVFAGLSEVLQNFSIDRDPAMSDALINCAGLMLGYLPLRALRRRFQPYSCAAGS